MYPVEIFGEKTNKQYNKSSKYFCRFLGSKCDKQSRLLKYPMGVCSVYNNFGNSIICPHRFLEDGNVFKDIVIDKFGTDNNILLFPEVRLNNVGTFDFVLVKHRPISKQVDDFCIVEFQSDSTTGTGKLVKAVQDYMKNINVQENKYSFGLNTYNTIKLSYIQMLIKGQVMEKWGKSIYWVMQNYLYDNMINRFQLSDMEYRNDVTTRFFLYDLIDCNINYKIGLTSKKSSSVSNLLKAFTEQPTPQIDDFIKVLESKIELNLGIKVGKK